MSREHPERPVAGRLSVASAALGSIRPMTRGCLAWTGDAPARAASACRSGRAGAAHRGTVMTGRRRAGAWAAWHDLDGGTGPAGRRAGDRVMRARASRPSGYACSLRADGDTSVPAYTTK
jgi:hypothetical protein